MSFETKGQELFHKVAAVALYVAIWSAAILGSMWLIKSCGLQAEQRCVCDCGGVR
jgi:hypothetical protein